MDFFSLVPMKKMSRLFILMKVIHKAGFILLVQTAFRMRLNINQLLTLNSIIFVNEEVVIAMIVKFWSVLHMKMPMLLVVGIAYFHLSSVILFVDRGNPILVRIHFFNHILLQIYLILPRNIGIFWPS